MTAIIENYNSIDDLPEATLRISNRLYDLIADVEDIERYGTELEKDVEINPKDVTNALEIAITQMPAKMSAWAAITRVISLKKPMFVSDMINLSQAQISSEIIKGNLIIVKYFLRYLAALVNLNLINPNHFMLLMEMFLGVAKEPSTPLPKADGFVYLVLATLPWACQKLHAEVGLDLAKLMAFLSSYMSSRLEKKNEIGLNRVINSVSVYRNVEEGKLYEQLDVRSFDNF
jgi:nuclear cap-binding protein subunit 1